MRIIFSLVIFCCLISACKKEVTLDQRVIGTVENFCNKDAISNLKLRIMEVGPIGTNTDLSVYPQREKASTLTDDRGVYEFRYDINPKMLYTISLEAPDSELGYFGEGARTINQFSPLVEHTFKLCNKSVLNISFSDTLLVDSVDVIIGPNFNTSSCYSGNTYTDKGISNLSKIIQDTIPCGSYSIRYTTYTKGNFPEFHSKEILLFPDERIFVSIP